jgi:two-component system chemotaxis sensor kinase CheA
MNDDKELMDVFFKEAHGLLDEMRRELTSLSEEPNTANLDNLFRCAHTLKGSSGSVGFGKVYEISLLLQDIFKSAKNGRLEISADIIPLLSRGVEACQKLLNGEEVQGIGELTQQLNRIAS